MVQMVCASVYSATFLSIVAFCVVKGEGGAQAETNEDGLGGKMSFSPPTLDDEESHSPWMPDNLKCDGCRAVSFQLWNRFKKEFDKRKSLKGNFPESEVIDMVEDICNNKESFQGYGIRTINGIKRLNGPGLPDANEPGVIAGGGKWPARLHDICDQFIGEIEEMQIYNIFKEKPNDKTQLEKGLCWVVGNSVRGLCVGGPKDEL